MADVYPARSRSGQRPSSRLANIIIKGKTRTGKTRSEQEENLRKEGWGTMSDENLAKTKYLERRAKEEWNSDKNFISQVDAERVK